MNVNNSSGFHGVSAFGNGRWRAQARHNGTLHYLGTFADAADAARAVNCFWVGLGEQPRNPNVGCVSPNPPAPKPRKPTVHRNARKMNSRNQSGYRGVSWWVSASGKGSWRAQALFAGTVTYLGMFDNPEAAGVAVNNAWKARYPDRPTPNPTLPTTYVPPEPDNWSI
ncbi:MAG: hypothetical protein C0467_24710 [Planctomycetaceae bacterium]|nr:hypothetical protein [Planctomycetaceae bacterium]